MKDTLKRIMGIGPSPAKAETTVQTETTKEIIDMVKPETGEVSQASAESIVADMASLSASVAELTSKLSAAEDQIATLSTALANAKSEKAAAAMDARKAKVVAAVGTEKADALLASLSSLTDPAFDAVMDAMSVTSKAEAQSKLFTEQGVDASANVAAVTEAAKSNPVMDLLKAKYAPK